jgi:hypothetical protein
MSLIKKITKTIDISINDFCATLAEKFDLDKEELLEIWKQNVGSSSVKSKTVKKRSAYVNYSMYLRPILLEENPDMTFGEISGETSKRWKIMSADEKLEYQSTEVKGKSVETKLDKKFSPKNKFTVKESDPNDLDSKKVAELKEMCKAKGLALKGTKAELIERLSESNKDVASPSAETDCDGSPTSLHSPVLELGEMDEEADAENSECGISPVSMKSLMVEEPELADESEEDEIEEKINYSDLSLAQIKAICKEKGVSTKGNKNELIHRLMA